MKRGFILVAAPALLLVASQGCSSGGGSGGALSCADGGACPPGTVCSPQLVCVASGTGGNAGSGFGGSGGGFGGSGGGFGGSGGGFGGSGGGFGGTGGVGGVGGTGGTGTFDCTGYCQKWASANCPSDPTLSECITSCQNETAAVGGQCASQATAWLECVKTTATISCSATGTSETSDCLVQNQAYLACGICLFPLTTPCGTCTQQNCCSQLKAYYSDPNASALLGCLDACTDQTCFDACFSQYPTATTKYNAWAQCQQTYCSTQCA